MVWKKNKEFKLKPTKKNARLKHIPMQIVRAISKECEISTPVVKRVVIGLRTALIKELRAKKTLRIPHICTLRIKTVKARPEETKTLRGRQVLIKARPERKRVYSLPLRKFRIDVLR